MLSSLASLLFLGIVAPPPVKPLPRPLPGIERLQVSAPSKKLAPLSIPVLSASGALLLDAESGEELWSREPDVERPMASLTKIMTALLILEHHDTNEVAILPPITDNVHGSTIGLIPGQHMTIGSLLQAMLIPSANDASYALATVHSRSIGGFVRAMNERAQVLGLEHTHFQNPAGLDDPGQYSSPRDLGWLTLAALKHRAFRSIVSTRSATIQSSEGKEYQLRNTNELLHYNEDVDGVKTGTTDNAGECLIVLFREAGHPYLLILLGSSDRYTDSLHVLKSIHAASS